MSSNMLIIHVVNLQKGDLVYSIYLNLCPQYPFFDERSLGNPVLMLKDELALESSVESFLQGAMKSAIGIKSLLRVKKTD